MTTTILNLESEISRKGARACFQALRDMETAAELTNIPGQTWEQKWRDQQAAFDILLKVAGDTTPFLRGFLLTLAEYVDKSNNSGQPILDEGGWIPQATMTVTEVAAYRQNAEAIFNGE